MLFQFAMLMNEYKPEFRFKNYSKDVCDIWTMCGSMRLFLRAYSRWVQRTSHTLFLNVSFAWTCPQLFYLVHFQALKLLHIQ